MNSIFLSLCLLAIAFSQITFAAPLESSLDAESTLRSHQKRNTNVIVMENNGPGGYNRNRQGSGYGPGMGLGMGPGFGPGFGPGYGPGFGGMGMGGMGMGGGMGMAGGILGGVLGGIGGAMGGGSHWVEGGNAAPDVV